MKKKVNIKESFRRFNAIQKITTLFFIFTVLFAFGAWLFLEDFKLFLVLVGIAGLVTIMVFNVTKKNNPFVITKSSLEQFRLMGEVNFYRVEKKYLATSPFSSQFRIRNLLMLREYRQDGTLFQETPYKKGKIWGEVKTYGVNGKIRKSATYRQGDIDGMNIETDVNGVKREKNYKGAHLHGTSKTYDKDTGNLISEENFRNGVPHGLSVFYDSKTGNKIREENFKDGRKYGKTKEYDENENLIKETEYRDNLIHGKTIEYFPGGTIKSEVDFEMNKKEGVAKEFYEDGTIKTEKRYRKDEKHGPQMSYYKSGDIMSKHFYDSGEKKGKPIFYDPDGNPVG
ncbi:MAG: toxin-antitoxin system YwqK family antitoxin [Fidelibacterota bacterium]